MPKKQFNKLSTFFTFPVTVDLKVTRLDIESLLSNVLRDYYEGQRLHQGDAHWQWGVIADDDAFAYVLKYLNDDQLSQAFRILMPEKLTDEDELQALGSSLVGDYYWDEASYSVESIEKVCAYLFPLLDNHVITFCGKKEDNKSEAALKRAQTVQDSYVYSLLEEGWSVENGHLVPPATYQLKPEPKKVGKGAPEIKPPKVKKAKSKK